MNEIAAEHRSVHPIGVVQIQVQMAIPYSAKSGRYQSRRLSAKSLELWNFQ